MNPVSPEAHLTFAKDVTTELEWLENMFHHRSEDNEADIKNVLPLPQYDEGSPFSVLSRQHHLNYEDRVLLALAIAGKLIPETLSFLLAEFTDKALASMLGGHVIEEGRQFIPTLRTAIFLLSGNSLEKKMYYSSRLNRRHILFLQGVINLQENKNSAYALNEELILNEQYLDFFLYAKKPRLDSDPGFAAYLGETKMTFENVVLTDFTRKELEKLNKYLQNQQILFGLKGVNKRFKSSYLTVFNGLPGTGKTLTALTIGKQFNIPVYIVNLSQVVSKYIGETEKNMDKIFDRLHGQNCILFFDEADAIFGKRTEVNDSKDRYANQETAYLLQKTESFSGVIILATNLFDIESAFDIAFQRRIRKTIYFEFPRYNERMILWKEMLPEEFVFEEGLPEKLSSYQLMGASINSVMFDSLIEAVDRKTDTLTWEIMHPFLEQEFKKTGNRKCEPVNDELADRDMGYRIGTRNMNRLNFKK